MVVRVHCATIGLRQMTEAGTRQHINSDIIQNDPVDSVHAHGLQIHSAA